MEGATVEMREDMKAAVNVLDFHNPQTQGDNMTPAVGAAIAEARPLSDPHIIFPKGVYHFRADGAYSKSYHMANNDAGSRAASASQRGISTALESRTYVAAASACARHGRQVLLRPVPCPMSRLGAMR